MVRGFGHVDYQAIPSVVYTHPEIAAVGYTEEELKAQGIPYKVGKFPYSASGRARAMGETEGFIKVLAHAKTDRILPTMDLEVSRAAERVFKKQGLTIRTGVRVTAVVPEAKGARVELEGGEVLEADRVLVAVGRRPYTEGLSLENAGLSTDERGRIPVDEHLRTRVPHIYAIGDVVRGPMLAHKASEEGICLLYTSPSPRD